MKTVRYSVIQKVQTIIASLAIGCGCIKEINYSLRPYRAAAAIFGMDRFPDQSQINRFLWEFNLSSIYELDLIMEELLKTYGLSRSFPKVDVDLDSTGLVVYGKTYQGASKGYFPRKRGVRGYRLSFAIASNTPFPEILSIHLDPGNVPPGARFWDGLYQVADLLGTMDRIGLVRADAAIGTGPDIQELTENGISLLVKGYDSRTAGNFAKSLFYDDWESVDLFTRVADLGKRKISNCDFFIRTVLVETIPPKRKKIKYIHLLTGLSPLQAEARELFELYNKRQTIEALIKADKHAFLINHLRTRGFYPIIAFLYFAAITHNLVALFRHHILSGTGLEDLGLYEIIDRLMGIPAKIKVNCSQATLQFPRYHPYTRKFILTGNS